jgi:hypothetical protein
MGQPLAEHHGAHTHRMAGVAIVATRAQMGSVGVGGPTAIVTVPQPADGTRARGRAVDTMYHIVITLFSELSQSGLICY